MEYCSICGSELSDDEIDICDNCKASIIHTGGIFQNEEDFT